MEQLDWFISFRDGCSLRARRFFLNAPKGGDNSKSGTEVDGVSCSRLENPLPDGPSAVDIAEFDVCLVAPDPWEEWRVDDRRRDSDVGGGSFLMSLVRAGSWISLATFKFQVRVYWGIPMKEVTCALACKEPPLHAFQERNLEHVQSVVLSMVYRDAFGAVAY